MIRSLSHKPIYREVVRHALTVAWKDWRYWPLALVASFLFTAGSYDVLWKAITAFLNQPSLVQQSAGHALVKSFENLGPITLDGAFSILTGLEILVVIAMIFLALAVLSCACQGALVFALGARHRGHAPTLKESFHVGAGALWPIIALNALTFVILWILRFIATFPLWLTLQQTPAIHFVSIASYAIYILLALFLCVLHILTLNAMILQGASLADALRRGAIVIRKHWLVTLESILLQAIAAIAIGFVFTVGLAFLLMPAYILFVSSAWLGSSILFSVSLITAALIAVVVALVYVSFNAQFQYATWTALYRRLGEGGAIPKIHRLVRNLFGFFRVPQS